ncbi:MAG TPA: hypothetical protein VFR42_10635 [Candidatus Acidoferrum sp.]|nr:hypothetical protein [Candidatus Acidoferrum sp.]
MRKLASFAVLFGMFGLPAWATTETFNGVSVIDTNCSKKAAADPDAHTRECALKCQASGYGIITKDHKYLKFDSAGNTKITEALKLSDKKDHLRVDVTGDVNGDTLQVTSIKLL